MALKQDRKDTAEWSQKEIEKLWLCIYLFLIKK